MKLTEKQQQLVEDNIKLVGFVIKKSGIKFNNYKIEYEDLYQIGCLGLCRAVETFDPEYGSTFSTYAYIVIRNEILRELVRINKIPGTVDLSLYEEDIMSVDVPEDKVVAHLYSEEIMSTVRKAYEEASEAKKKYIDVLLLRIQGFKNTEIAQMINWSPETVSKAEIRAKKYLKTFFESERKLVLPA